jgi:hypothetical protein
MYTNRGKQMLFGFGIYYPRQLPHERQSLGQALQQFAGYSQPDPVRIQGMISDSDRYSPPRKLSASYSAELADRITAGAFSDVLAFKGTRRDPISQLSLSIRPCLDAAYRFGFFLSEIRTAAELTDCVHLAMQLSECLRSVYGFGVLGETSVAVMSELTATPIRSWDAPDDPDEDERLIRIQQARPVLGNQVRGGSWAVMLGAHLVSQLGGERRVHTEAPVELVQSALEGRLYLQLSHRPLLIGSEEYRIRVQALTEYLRPVTATRAGES